MLTLDLNSLSNPNFKYTEISNFVDENYYFYNTSQAGNYETWGDSTGSDYTEWILTDNFIIYMTFRPQQTLSTSDHLFYIQMADVKIKLFDIKNKTSKDITFYNDEGLGLNSSNTGAGHCFGFYCFFTFNDNIHFRYFNEQQSNCYIPCNKSKIYYASNYTNINTSCGFRMPETSIGYVAPNNYFFKSDNSTYDCTYFPFAISTINNLETPITKGKDQVMKITYTLTVD